MGSVITKNKKITPGIVVAGNPVKFIKSNEIGLSRNNITSDQLDNYIIKYNKLYESKQNVFSI
jgi:acyl-[acyl carrier protein]--UDP-N-acetylglucosamine O-acyltransferase